MRLGRARILAAAAAISTLAGVFVAAAIPAASATTAVSGASVALSASAATPLPAGAARIGATPAGTRVTFDVALNLGNQAGLDALLNGLTNKKSPYYRHFLAKDQFGPQFGLSLAQIAQVTSALRSLGLDPGQADAARLDIPVTATAAAIDRAFRITMTDYRLPDGRIAYANSAAPTVPASVAPYIEGVLGLDSVYQPQALDARVTAPVTTAAVSTPAAVSPAASGPKPCMAATDTAVDFSGYTADQLAAHYYMSDLYKIRDFGQGVHVAVAELEPNLASDVTAFEACYGIHTKVNYITVTPGVGTGAGSGEAALDIDNIAGLAPDATIDDYQSPNTATSLLDIATKVLDNDTDQVLSISWGLCEAEVGGSLLTHYQSVFSALNAENITVVGATGDVGPAGCYVPGGKAAPKLSVDSPASANYVIAVGGTQLSSATPLSRETAWDGPKDNPGAGGGGVSTLCMPSYQVEPGIAGLISKYSKRSKACVNSSNPHGYLRQVPDVSADASGSSSYVVYYDKAWSAFYGTSGATTLVAAETALIDASPYCGPKGWSSGPAGLLPQSVYWATYENNLIIYLSTPPVVLRDVTVGNTDDKASGYTGGLYPATKGYDMATGLGTPLLSGGPWGLPYFAPGMALDTCFYNAPLSTSTISTTGVFPPYARAGKPATVTVHGTAMLELPYSDQLDVSNHDNLNLLTESWANCPSHTACKVTIPAEKAGTYQLELFAGDFGSCDTCKLWVGFRFVAPPHITKLSTYKGGRGTKVTIRGSNFIGVDAVYFGLTKATSVKVLSSTELTAVVPAGSGKVLVKVVTVGGISNKLKFTY